MYSYQYIILWLKNGKKVACWHFFYFFREEENKVKLSWYVNTNEDVGGFRLELRSSGIPQTTLFSKELPYDQREEVVQVSPEFGDDWTMCVLVENSAGRLRRWKQENCRRASFISSGNRVYSGHFGVFVSFMAFLGWRWQHQWLWSGDDKTSFWIECRFLAVTILDCAIQMHFNKQQMS